MKCAGLKERCKWPEVGGLGPVVDKGKGKAKEVTMLPRGGEKWKKKKTIVKVVDDDEIIEVLGPSGKRSRFNPDPFLEWLDRLTGAVEEMTGQMHWVADATHLVARGNEQLTAGLKTFLEECCFFTVPGTRMRTRRTASRRTTRRRLNRRSRGSKRSKRILAALRWSKWSGLDSL